MNAAGQLDILWMTGLPAPEVVLSLMSCTCSRSCKPDDCSCILNNMNCSAACKLKSCTNMAEEFEESDIHQYYVDDSDDDDDI